MAALQLERCTPKPESSTERLGAPGHVGSPESFLSIIEFEFLKRNPGAGLVSPGKHVWFVSALVFTGL